MKNFTVDMTTKIKEINTELVKLLAYKDALKCKVFVRTKTIVNAIIAYEAIRTKFWKAVTKQWPETRLMSGTVRVDDTINFVSHEIG